MYSFNVKHATEKCIDWTRNWVDSQGSDVPVIIGMSGGKDSTTVCGILKEAIGKERIYGVIMPNTYQSDLKDAEDVCEYFGIDYTCVNIGPAVDAILDRLPGTLKVTQQTTDNLPPRIRMATLYAISQSMGGRVVNNCNASEEYVGYSTIYGDAAGDFGPIQSFTVSEVIEIGKYLGIPDRFMLKAPADGLCGKTDEDNLGFPYAVLDRYIRTGQIEDSNIRELIDRRHAATAFKRRKMAIFEYRAA